MRAQRGRTIALAVLGIPLASGHARMQTPGRLAPEPTLLPAAVWGLCGGPAEPEPRAPRPQVKESTPVLSFSQIWGLIYPSSINSSWGLIILSNKAPTSLRPVYIPESMNLVRARAYLSFRICIPALARYLAYGKHLINIYEINATKYHQTFRLQVSNFLER